jgi:hypothetical protein
MSEVAVKPFEYPKAKAGADAEYMRAFEANIRAIEAGIRPPDWCSDAMGVYHNPLPPGWTIIKPPIHNPLPPVRTPIKRHTNSRPTHLYRHFDPDGRPLYVGISVSAYARLAEHRSGAHWFGSVATMTVESFPTRAEAEAAEKEAIALENPAWNIRGVRRA